MLYYYVIDTETTGLKANYHEMTEIGIIRCSDRVQIHRLIKCDYPERANFDALAITKKTMADLEKGYDKNYVVEECIKFFEEDGGTPAHRCIIAHNANFDKKFLHALWAQNGKKFPANLWLDTMSMTKEYIKMIGLDVEHKEKGLPKPKVNLHAACDIAKIKKFADAHNAKVDSRNTYLLYKSLIDKNVNHLPLIKTDVHGFDSSSEVEEGGLDPDLLD
jgi:DNA polymerase III epsilon subunit-like protein